MNKSLGVYNLIDKEKIDESIKRVLENNIDYNTYVTPKGLKELREKISEVLMHNWSYNVNYSDILITSGTQQSINLIACSLINRGDTILIEQPTYFGAIDVFKNAEADLVGVSLNENGLNLKELEEKIVKYHPKLIYTIPTFNNPTGYSWDNESRKEFLKIINKYNILVIEDDPYSFINFTGYKYKSLYELNNKKNIIYLGTFSKIISPSINIGYIIANKEIIDKVYSFKESFDLCTSAFIQYVILDYLNNYNLIEIMKNKINKYVKLLDDSINTIKKYDIESYSKSKGGIFYLVKFKDKVDEKLFENGSKYYVDGEHSNESRINICS